PGHRVPPGEILPASDRPAAVGRRLRRAPAPPLASEPPYLRPGPQHLDFDAAGPGLPRQGLHAPRPQHRGRPPSHQAPGRQLAAGQALDQQPRPRLRAKKKARDRLIRLALTHPDWVLGFQDECWWSRLAQPQLRAWATDEPLRLLEL